MCPKEKVEAAYVTIQFKNGSNRSVRPRFELDIEHGKNKEPAQLLKHHKVELPLNPTAQPAQFIYLPSLVQKLSPLVDSNPYTARILSGPTNSTKKDSAKNLNSLTNHAVNKLRQMSNVAKDPKPVKDPKQVIESQQSKHNSPEKQLETNLKVCVPTVAGNFSFEVTATGLVNWNHVLEELAVTFITPGEVQVQKNQNVINQALSLRAQSFQISQGAWVRVIDSITLRLQSFKNEGYLSTQKSWLTVTAHDWFKNYKTGVITVHTGFSLEVRQIVNEGLLSSQNQTNIITQSFLQKLEGRLKTRNLSVKTGKLNNGGLISAENAILEAEHFENTGVVELFGTEDPVILSGKTVTNQGRISASALIKIRASQFKNTLKGLLSSQTSALIVDTCENFGVLEVLEELIVSSNRLTTNQGQITSEGSIKITTEQFQQLLKTARTVSLGTLTVEAVSIENAGLISGSCVKVQRGPEVHPGEVPAAKTLNNLGSIAGQAIILHAEQIHNKTTGKMGATQSLHCTAIDLKNQGQCTTKILGLTIEKQLTNEAAAQIRCHSGKIAAETIVQQGRLSATEKLVATAKTFLHTQGEVSAQELTINAIDIHLNAPVKGNHVEIRGKNIHITTPIEAEGDIEIFHEGGAWEVPPDMLRAKGKVTIHFKEGREIEPRETIGSLHYILDKNAKEPLIFHGDQRVAKALEVDAPTPVILGDEFHYVSLLGEANQPCQSVSIRAPKIDLVQVRILTIAGITLEAIILCLGRFSGNEYHHSFLKGGKIILSASGTDHMIWHQIVMDADELIVLGKQCHLDNISSEVFIRGNACLNVASSKHHLWVEAQDWTGQPVWSHPEKTVKKLGDYQRALTPSACFFVGGTLTTVGPTQVSGSQLYCSVHQGPTPIIETFIPSQDWTIHPFAGAAYSGTTEGAPFQGVFRKQVQSMSEPRPLTFAEALALRGVQRGFISPSIFLRDCNPERLKEKKASLLLRLFESVEEGQYVLEGWVSHRDLGGQPLCLSARLSQKTLREFGLSQTLLFSSLKNFYLLPLEIQKTLANASVQVSPQGMLDIFNLPPDRFSYVFETAGVLQLHEVSSQAGEIAVLNAARVKVFGRLEAAFGLLVNTVLFDTQDAIIQVSQGRSILRGAREGRPLIWWNDRGHCVIKGDFDIAARTLSNKQATLKLGSHRNKALSSFRISKKLDNQAGSFVVKQDFKGVIHDLRVTQSSVFHVEGEAYLTVRHQVVCRDRSRISALGGLTVLCPNVYADESSLIKGDWRFVGKRYHKRSHPNGQTKIVADKAILESPLVSSTVELETTQVCDLSRGAYAPNTLTARARRRFTYQKIDAGKRLNVVQLDQDCQLQHPLNTQASVFLKGLTTGATQAPLTTKRNVTFKATLQDPAVPYPIRLTQPVMAENITYQGKGVTQRNHWAHANNTVDCNVENVDIDPSAGQSAKRINTQALGFLRWHETAFNATELLTLKLREGRVFNIPLLLSGGFTFQVEPTATQPLSLQAPIRTGAYLVYLHPGVLHLEPSQKALAELHHNLDQFHRQHLPMLIRIVINNVPTVHAYGLAATGNTQLTAVCENFGRHPLFSKIEFPEEHTPPLGFRGEEKMMVEIYRIFKEKQAHFAPPMPFTLNAPSIPVVIGKVSDAAPMPIQALHGAFIMDARQLGAAYVQLYARDGANIHTVGPLTVGHPIAPPKEQEPAKAYSGARFEGAVRFQSEQAAVEIYSTIVETVGVQKDFRVETPSRFVFQGSDAQIGGNAYFPKDTRIEIGVASRASSYNEWVLEEHREDHRVLGIGRHHKTSVVSVLKTFPCTEQWPTTRRARFNCQGTAFCNGIIKVLGSDLQAGQIYQLDGKTATEILATHFSEQRVVVNQDHWGFGFFFRKRRRDPGSKLVTICTFPANVRGLKTLELAQSLGTGSGWGTVVIVQAKNFHYGETANLQLSILYPHEPVWHLAQHLRLDAAYTFDSPYSMTLQSCLLPIAYPQYEEAPILIKQPDGSLTPNTTHLPKLFNTHIEFQLVNRAISHQLGKPLLPSCRDEKENYEKVVLATQQYFNQLFGNGIETQALQLHSSQLTFEDPILVYKEVVAPGGKRALSPVVLNPYKAKHIALYYASLRGDYLIVNIDTGVITGNLIGDKGVKISARHMEVRRLQYAETRRVVVTETSRKHCRKKTNSHVIEQTDLTSQLGSGNIAVLEGLLDLTIEDFYLQGATISATGGIKGKLGKLVIIPNQDRYWEHHQTQARNFLQKYAKQEYLARFHVVQASLESAGEIDLYCSESARLVACRLQGDKGIRLHAEGPLFLEDMVTRHELGSQASSKKLMLTITRGAKEEHVPVVFLSGGKVEVRSNSSIHGIAPQTFGAQGIKYVAPKVRIDARILNTYLQSKSSGISGLKAVKQTTQMQSQVASQMVSISQMSDVEYRATKYDLVLQAPLIKAAKTLSLQAKQNVRLESVEAVTVIDARTYSAGLQFFGSDAVQALMQKDFKLAAEKLLKSLPVLGDIKTVMESRDLTDGLANTVKGLYQTYSFMKSMGTSGNFWEDLGEGLKKMMDVGVRFGFGESFESSTLALIPWLMARDIIMIAEKGNIETEGVKAQADNAIVLKAAQKIDSKAAAEHHQQQSKEQGVTPSFNPFTQSVGVSVDFQQQKAKAIQFKQSLFEAQKVTFLSGEEINLSGVCVRAQHAFLESQVIRMTSLQDEAWSHQQAGSVSIGSSGGVGGSASSASSHSKTTQATTEIQAGQSLHIRAHKSTHLTGVKIGVGNQGKPLQVQLSSQATQALYEYPLPEDGDSLFHALGIPRALACKQLLKGSNNKAVQELLALEILDLVTTQPLPVCLQQPELLVVIKNYHEALFKASASFKGKSPGDASKAAGALGQSLGKQALDGESEAEDPIVEIVKWLTALESLVSEPDANPKQRKIEGEAAAYYEVNVPGDGTCLFYSVTFAYLLPVVSDPSAFRKRFVTLFGEAAESLAEENRLKLLTYDGNAGFIREHQPALETLVNENFRGRLVSFMRDKENREAFRTGFSEEAFNRRMAAMENPSFKVWGDEPEIAAMTRFLEVNIKIWGNRRGKLIPQPWAEHGHGKADKIYLVHENEKHYHYLIRELPRHPQQQAASRSLELSALEVKQNAEKMGIPLTLPKLGAAPKSGSSSLSNSSQGLDKNPRKKEEASQSKADLPKVDPNLTFLASCKEALTQAIRTPEVLKAYIVGHLAQPTTLIGLSRSLEALCYLNGFHLKIVEEEGLKVTHEYLPSSHGSKTLTLRYFAKEGHFNLLHTQPGLFISPVLTYQDLEDIERSHQTQMSVGFSPASELGTVDAGHQQREKRELHRTTVSNEIDIQTQSDIARLNRDLAKAKEITRNSKTHVRVFTPIGSAAALKNMAQEMPAQLARIPAYFKPNTVEHYQSQALQEQLKTYQKEKRSPKEIEERLRDEAILADIAKRGNQAFVEQYCTRIGVKEVPKDIQEYLDRGLTPHFERGADGEQILRFDEPQHIGLATDKRGRLHLMVEFGERSRIAPALNPAPMRAKQSSNNSKVKQGLFDPALPNWWQELALARERNALQSSDSQVNSHRAGSGRSNRSSREQARTRQPARWGSDHSAASQYSLSMDNLGKVDKPSLLFDITKQNRKPEVSLGERVLNFFCSPVYADSPASPEERAVQRRRENLFFYAHLQEARRTLREGVLGKGSQPNLLDSSEPISFGFQMQGSTRANVDATRDVEFTPYTAAWFKRWGKALLGDQSPTTLEWQQSNNQRMTTEKAFIEGFLARQGERYGLPTLLPKTSQPNSLIEFMLEEGFYKPWRPIGRVVDHLWNGTAHLDTILINTTVLVWDGINSASWALSGPCSQGTLLRGQQRLAGLQQAYDSFLRLDLSGQRDMALEMGATMGVTAWAGRMLVGGSSGALMPGGKSASAPKSLSKQPAGVFEEAASGGGKKAAAPTLEASAQPGSKNLNPPVQRELVDRLGSALGELGGRSEPQLVIAGATRSPMILPGWNGLKPKGSASHHERRPRSLSPPSQASTGSTNNVNALERARNNFNTSKPDPLKPNSSSQHNAQNVNAQTALNRKMSALEFAQRNASKTETLPDGRVRYYAAERPSKTPGQTRGASYVTEHNPTTGQVRSWMEAYDQNGNINRIHPKMIDGQSISGQHYPATKAELESFTKLSGRPK